MGRLGERLFESDLDMDLASDFDTEALPLSNLVQAWGNPDDETNIDEIRIKLDKGAGKELLDAARKREAQESSDPLAEYTSMMNKYSVVILGAVLMRAGAKIPHEHMDHLRELASGTTSPPHYTSPFMDIGFRDPGKVQYLAALDHYKPGVPRSFTEPSCFTCGKIKEDTGTEPLKCGRCKLAWYCDKACQAANWKVHKVQCAKFTGGSFMLNV